MSKSRDKAYNVIKNAVLDGTFTPGERLIEAKLVALIGVSRTPIREAIKQLTADNYLVMRPNSGVAVADWGEHELEDIFKLRAMTEGLVARRASKYITDEQIAALRRHTDEIDKILASGPPFDIPGFLEENAAFHQTIVSAANSQILAQALERLISPPIVYKVAHNFTAAELTRSNSHHKEIIDSMEARDGDWADHSMQSHVMSAYNRMRSLQKKSLPFSLESRND
ncbi:GntR family transcriptional regulator [Kordiimonas sp.]|uniref:GntR family transcriptional regulator n=1 Tax=Kordiimonas sp. TaxID=1970157 RepID=UPI003A8FD7DF